MEQDSWTWGGLITKTAMVVGAVLAAPIVLPAVGGFLSQTFTGAAVGPAASAWEKIASLASQALNSLGYGLTEGGRMIAGISASAANSLSSATAGVGTIPSTYSAGQFLAGTAQSSVLSNTGSAIASVATNAADVARRNPGATAALVGTGFFAGNVLSSRSAPVVRGY